MSNLKSAIIGAVSVTVVWWVSSAWVVAVAGRLAWWAITASLAAVGAVLGVVSASYVRRKESGQAAAAMQTTAQRMDTGATGHCWKDLAGLPRIVASTFIHRENRDRALAVCSTCMGICSSGRTIGMVIMERERWWIQ